MPSFGIGIDRVLIHRIATAFERWGYRFAHRVLGPGELEVFDQRVRAHPRQGLHYLAKRFAAKEAFAKAMGCGLRSPMFMPRLDILNDAYGKPVAHAHGDLKQWLADRGLTAHISLTDEQDAAMAIVMLEADQANQ